MKLSIATAFILFLLLVPAFVPFLFAHQSLYQGDIFLYFEPTLSYLARNILAGRFPLWNPLVCGGVPQIAIISPGLFYLPNALFLCFPFGLALGLSLMLHQWLAGFGTFLFLKAKSGQAFPATVGGAIVMLCGYMFGSSQCYTLPATFAWTPLALYFLERLLITGAMPWLAGLAATFGMQILAGRPELFGGALAIYIGYAALHSWQQRKAALLIKPLSALVLGIAMAGVALLPVLELYSLSPRMSGLRYGEVSLWSAGWFDWLQLIVTQPFGDLVVGSYQLSPHYPGLFPYISSLFLGPTAITLCILGFCQTSWRLRWFWLAVAIFFALLALGSFGPLLPLMYSLLPGAAVLRYPIKLAIFALFALAVAAAEGWQAGTTCGITRRVAVSLCGLWTIALIAGLVLWFNISSGATSAAMAILGHRFSSTGTDMLKALQMAGSKLCLAAMLGYATVGLCALVSWKPAKAKWSARLLLILALLPMSVSGQAYLWHTIGQSFYEQSSPVAQWVQARQRKHKDSFRTLDFLPDSLLSPVYLWRPKDPLLHSILQSAYERQILQADVNMDFNVPSPYGFMATDSKAFMMTFVGVCWRSHQYPDAERVGSISDLPLYRFCQISNTRYLVTLTNRPDPVHRTIELMPKLDARFFVVTAQMPELNVRIYKIAYPLARAYFRAHWDSVPSQIEALKQIFWADRSSFDPVRSVLINNEGQPLPEDPQPEGKQPAAIGELDLDSEPLSPAVTVVSDSGEKVELAVENSVPGFCVLSDTQYPGWKAYDGDTPLRIYQANGLYRAVWLKPGRHHISFIYKPYSLFWGEVLSLGSLFVIVIILAGGIYDHRKRRRLAA